MSGVTNSAFRRLMREENPGALGLVVTEFVSVEGLTRQNKRTIGMCRFKEEERPLAVQIFGYDIERICEAGRLVEQEGADVLDLNCGCPVPKVVRRGGGCELMRQPEHMSRMLASLRKAVSLPLSVKIRAGWDPKSKNAPQIAKIAEDSGVDLITVHGRTRTELYRGEADWDVVAEVARSVKVPVVGSGDVVCIESAERALRSGASGLMIGRGALGNPWIFSDILAASRGGACFLRDEFQLIRVLRRYRELLSEELPDKAVIGRLKQMTAQASKGRRGGAIVRRAVCTAKSLQEIEDIFNLWGNVLSRSVNTGYVSSCQGDGSLQ
jgi:nifR3 family TIM-barrel protein